MSPAHTPWSLDVMTIARIIWRRKFVLGGTVAGVLFLALVWLVQQPAQYSAKAVLQLNARNSQVVEMENVLSHLGTDQAVLQSEIDLLRSTYMAKRIADALNLYEDPNFNTTLKEKTWVQTIKRTIFGATVKSQQAIALKVIENVKNAFRVYTPARSLTINISARALSAKQAALLANTMATEYLKDQTENRLSVTQDANTWLESRLSQLREDVQTAEANVQAYMEENSLFEQQGLTMTDQQLVELSSQLILARTSRAEAEAKVYRARQLMRRGETASSAEVLKSPLIQTLRAQEAEVARKEADLATRYGAKHPEMQKVKAEKTDIQAQIQQEVRNIMAGYENDAAIARTRERELARNLKAAQTDAGVSTAAGVQLAQLKREAAANRAVYESFLNRFKETSQQEGLTQTDARLVSAATPPLTPSHPKKMLILIAAFIFGSALGVFITAILEMLDKGFRTEVKVEEVLDAPVVGQIPLLKENEHVAGHVVNKPTSLYAEGLRNIRTSLHFVNPDNPPQVVLVTSAIPGEGKSSLASALGTLLAQAGKKVLVMDCDLRKPSLASVFDIKTKETLADVLVGDTTAKKAIHKHSYKVDILIAKQDTPHSQELLSSEKMTTLLEELKKTYDTIILDAPPITAVSDALVLTEKADVALFVTRWGTTPRTLAAHALKSLRKTRVRLAGVVLSQVDMKQMHNYSSRYYESYSYASKYYTE